ncbi:ABC transporter substrate-binding protein [Bosea sp. (in: a-proteobacteria)]|uniref:ABC transporter substrate-binding protein n=1 Tax=Bosea sp. (in: a-proteobacteria) TaxID=1871050 RepID=UPI00262AE0F8|nr:ABC transporter substrate-binding protein [Bosea sp. (in: a-proteobacteria)]MCO5091325.1 ABC transporter substrate-binding protein [Bosea sp. (in: a-proteobacteria)]
MTASFHPTRRAVAVGASALAALPIPSFAQQFQGPIRVGGLVPLTGAGAPHGPTMMKIHRAIVEDVNRAGGIFGQKIEYFGEDDQTNPDAGVLATRKLIDVDRVSAIISVWASSVGAAMLPICWQNKVIMFGITSADSLSAMPHQGYFIRTHPDTGMQGRKLAEFAIKRKAKQVYVLAPQQPYAEPFIRAVEAACTAAGTKATSVIYDIRKTSFRTEVDQLLKAQPDVVLLGGLAPDNIIMTRDLYRAGVKAPIIGLATGVNQAVIDGAGKQVVEGLYTQVPVPALGSPGYKRVQEIAGTDQPDTYACQAFDHINLFILSVARAKAATGTAIKDTIRSVSSGSGEVVTDALAGLAILREGRPINYDGASGPCSFEPNGSLSDCEFQLQQIRDGKLVNVTL